MYDALNFWLSTLTLLPTKMRRKRGAGAKTRASACSGLTIQARWTLLKSRKGTWKSALSSAGNWAPRHRLVNSVVTESPRDS